MRAVLQRVEYARVTVNGELAGEIGKGVMVLIGVSEDDTETIADKMADKICKLRIFQDENGKTNLSMSDVGGGILAISQFTLYADCAKGNRPSFIRAGDPKIAKHLYERFVARCREQGIRTECGVFGAEMKVELLNDGPFTLTLDSGVMR